MAGAYRSDGVTCQKDVVIGHVKNGWLREWGGVTSEGWSLDKGVA